MVNLVQSKDRWELLLNECFDHSFDRLIGPFFKWFLETDLVQTPRNN